MLSDLKFIIGAVARKDIIESLCHLTIKDGRAVAFDGLLSMSTPIDIKLTIRPHAKTFMHAIKACSDDAPISLHVTPAGRLSVRCGKFRAFVKCIDESATALPEPEGAEVPLPPGFLASLKALQPVMGTDASRPWAMGLLIGKNSAYATNNVILAESWHGAGLPCDAVLPADCVNELLRIGDAPVKAMVTPNSMAFIYESGRWLRTTLINNDWPAEFGRILDIARAENDVPADFFDALTTLKNFGDLQNRVFVFADRVSTSPVDGDGASVDMASDADGACFQLEMLVKLSTIAKKISFAPYPKPCPFQGAGLRGVILGQRF